jgi:hypothetical protein
VSKRYLEVLEAFEARETVGKRVSRSDAVKIEVEDGNV